jgi:hypothetical protein
MAESQHLGRLGHLDVYYFRVPHSCRAASATCTFAHVCHSCSNENKTPPIALKQTQPLRAGVGLGPTQPLQMLASIEVHPKLVAQWTEKKMAPHKAAAPGLSVSVDQCHFRDGGCLQVSPAHTRDSLGIKGAELQGLGGNSEHPSSLWNLQCPTLCAAA